MNYPLLLLFTWIQSRDYWYKAHVIINNCQVTARTLTADLFQSKHPVGGKKKNHWIHILTAADSVKMQRLWELMNISQLAAGWVFRCSSPSLISLLGEDNFIPVASPWLISLNCRAADGQSGCFPGLVSVQFKPGRCERDTWLWWRDTLGQQRAGGGVCAKSESRSGQRWPAEKEATVSVEYSRKHN